MFDLALHLRLLAGPINPEAVGKGSDETETLSFKGCRDMIVYSPVGHCYHGMLRSANRARHVYSIVASPEDAKVAAKLRNSMELDY